MKKSSHLDKVSTYSSFERRTTPENALKIIKQIIKRHNLNLKTRFGGTELRTYQAFIIDEKNKVAFIGCGKGIDKQSEVSALFEAFEHYMNYMALHYGKKAIKLRVAKNKNIDFLIKTHMLPENYINLIGGFEVSLPWIKMHSLHDARSYILYPLHLIEPNYNEENKFSYDTSSYYNLSYLSNSNGCASGTNVDEAVLHALNEAIERDAQSLFLYNAFIRKKPIKIVNKNTIPTYLQNYINIIETQYNTELIIIDITSNIGVPCFCVTFTNYNVPIPPKGFGASLSKIYALERALLESLQPVHLRNEYLTKVENNTLNRLKDYPILQAAAVADVQHLIQDKKYNVIDFNEIEDLYASYSLIEQKIKILALLQAQGFYAYCHELHQLMNYSLVQVKVSGLSNLYLLQTGKLILPNINYFKTRNG